ncbi:probable membrane-associated kinase regulator 6 [Phtheirospermum japonicum]|uniref:Probable membrane-associated kinase regulator 6 n=1 Tax=Phtheirospermum japonicum TaxID=374723 RepID=A0A830B9A4_9LAMI|nr:probable membrane-associated kinase regulator 6 [Phtheirospermum japonicum]
MSYQTSSMETTTLQSPSIESFSYSWLANLNPISTVDHPSHDHDETSFIEMDPRLPPSKRFFRVSSSDHFCFDFPASDESPLGLVHADELISNGFVVPLFVKDNKDEMIKTHRFEHVDDYYSTSSTSAPKKRVRCGPLRKCQRLSKRFFEKYFKYLLRPFWCRLRRYPFDSRSGDVRMKWELSAATLSPRTSLAYSSADDNYYWRRSCDSESSIYEAVLHCKRTQGK